MAKQGDDGSSLIRKPQERGKVRFDYTETDTMAVLSSPFLPFLDSN